MTDVIGQLLRASLLGQLGEDENRLAKLRYASEEIARSLATTHRADLPSAVIAATDEKGHIGYAPLALAEQHLQRRWETLHITFPDHPIELLRATLLQGIVRAASGDEALRWAAWYVLRNALECGSAGRWTTYLSGIAGEWTAASEAVAANGWKPPTNEPALELPEDGVLEAVTAEDEGAVAPDVPAEDDILAWTKKEMPKLPTGYVNNPTFHAAFLAILGKVIVRVEQTGSAARESAQMMVDKAVAELQESLREADAAAHTSVMVT